MQNKQNVISYVDLNNSKIIVMLINGTSTKFAKIEEFEFEKKNFKKEFIFEVFPEVLESFIGENVCKQANFYCVLPQNYISYELIKVPNFNLTKTKGFIKSEVERICSNASDFYFQEHSISRSKKITTYKVSLIKKDYISKINDAHKKLGLNLKYVGFDLNSKFSALHSLIKMKHSANLILDMSDNDTTFYYSNKERLLFTYVMPFGLNEIEKNKFTGVLQNSSDACVEVFFNSHIAKDAFAGIQLAVDGESKEKQKLMEKNIKIWKNTQENKDEVSVEFNPIKKIILAIQETIKENQLQPISAIYCNCTENILNALKMSNENQNVEIKDISLELKDFELKDYLSLYGILFDFKNQPESVFNIKNLKPKFVTFKR